MLGAPPSCNSGQGTSLKRFAHWLLWLLGLAALGYVGWGLLFADYGYMVYRQEAVQLEQLKSEIKTLKKKQQELTSEVLRLRNDPEALEELIHRELGYVHADEFMLVMPEVEEDGGRKATGSGKY